VDYKDIEHIDLDKIFEKQIFVDLDNKDMLDLELYIEYVNYIFDTYEELPEDVANNLEMDVDRIIAFLKKQIGEKGE
jgi:hypothetical protein